MSNNSLTAKPKSLLMIYRYLSRCRAQHVHKTGAWKHICSSEKSAVKLKSLRLCNVHSMEYASGVSSLHVSKSTKTFQASSFYKLLHPNTVRQHIYYLSISKQLRSTKAPSIHTSLLQWTRLRRKWNQHETSCEIWWQCPYPYIWTCSI